MSQLNTLYRALLEYKKHTSTDRECTSLKNIIKKADVENDEIDIITYTCKVDEDWIIAIEQGLVHVEKAIAEYRQFIRQDGEVVPIEKIKRVSKDSVEHLARHSDLITRIVEGQDLIPDKLYTVEKLSDYAVYENRFLYMMLCYLRDFISLRYNNIVEKTNTYDATTLMNKTIHNKHQKVVFEMKMLDQRKNDPFIREHNESKDIIRRIDSLLKVVLAYLSTPLMEEVAKSPMLKPPVTKTNVLKMNQNFKGALALYDYLVAYDKQGYEIVEKRKRINPFTEEEGDDFSEVVSLTSFLTYQYGNEIKDLLIEEYKIEEEKKKQEEAIRFQEQLKKMKKRVAESEMSVEEYMLVLEKRNRELEKDSAQLVLAKQEIRELNQKVEELTSSLEKANEKIQELEQEIARLIQKYIDDMNALKEAHRIEIENLVNKYETQIAELHETYQTQIKEMIEAHENEVRELKEAYETQISELKEAYETQILEMKEAYETQIANMQEAYETQIAELHTTYQQEINSLKEQHVQEIDEIKQAHAEEIASLEKEHENNLEALKEKHEAEVNKFNEEIEKLNNTIVENKKEHEVEVEQLKQVVLDKDSEISKINHSNDILEDEKVLAMAELNAKSKIQFAWLDDKSFTSFERFSELEEEFKIFKKFFNKEWGKTKKKIKKEVFEANPYIEKKKKKEVKEEIEEDAE